jgi:hypothetical protein
VDLEVNINVSEENIASILRAEVEQRKKSSGMVYRYIPAHFVHSVKLYLQTSMGDCKENPLLNLFNIQC